MALRDDIRQAILDRLAGKTPTKPKANYAPHGQVGVFLRLDAISTCQECGCSVLAEDQGMHSDWHVESGYADVRWLLGDGTQTPQPRPVGDIPGTTETTGESRDPVTPIGGWPDTATPTGE